MKTLCIYHANCADGFGAAWVVRQALGAENVDFHPGKYGEPAPEVEGRDVIIVDFSYKRAELLQLAQLVRSILIIDHHKSAAEDLAEIPPAPASYRHWIEAQQPLGALFDMQRSGAGLTWDFFNPHSKRPWLINHIEDRDLWRFEIFGTEKVMASLFTFPQRFETWDDLMECDFHDLHEEGAGILRKQAKDVADLVPNARRLTIGGHDVPALNCPHFMASDAGHILGQGEPFAACYSDTPKGRVFSLRSQPEGLDVSEVAKQYGGGGHRNAAGFTVPFHHELATGYLPATLESTEPSGDIVLTPAAQDILAQCVAAHAFVVAAITNGRPDAALAEARKWVESFHEAAQRLKENIEPMSFERDECGHWTHPAWPKDGDEDAIPRGWFADKGLEVCVIEFEHDATEEQAEAYFEQGDPDCSTWQPNMPIGEGWFVFSIHDTEDGPVCVWVRPMDASAEVRSDE